MTVEIISRSISTTVWDRARIELATPESALRQASVYLVYDKELKKRKHVQLSLLMGIYSGKAVFGSFHQNMLTLAVQLYRLARFFLKSCEWKVQVIYFPDSE